jgi:hypothetical protein
VTRLLLALLLALTVAAPIGCGKHRFGKDDLVEAAGRHYLDLRWSRVASAAKRVHPELREAFVTDWNKRSQEIEIHDLEVMDVQIDEEGDVATLTVQVSWVDRSSMTMKNATVQQEWDRTDDGWVAAEVLTLPGS